MVLNKQQDNNYPNIVGDSGMYNKSRSDMIDMGLSAQGLPWKTKQDHWNDHKFG